MAAYVMDLVYIAHLCGLVLKLGGEGSNAASALIWKRGFRKEQEFRKISQEFLKDFNKLHFEQAVSAHHE
jgi:hypothetical protein